MKVIIRNRLMTLKGGSTVKDENKNDVLKVKGKMFTITSKKYICDLSGKVLYTVRNKYWNFWGKKVFIYGANKRKVATVYYPPFSLKKFLVTGCEDEIVIDGKIFTLEYQITRNGKQIGTISNKVLTLTDSFCLEAAEEDIPFCTALVIAIDNIRDKIMHSTSSKSSSRR